jgi:FMN phosphatase YigB (HAD superfamily)
VRVIKLPERVRGVVFDIDGTLYDNREYAQYQVDVLIERLARERGEAVEDTRRTVEQWREEYAEAHGGTRQSIGNTFAGLGIPMEVSVRWREELIDPSIHLSLDTRLVQVMGLLSRELRLAALTNNPVAVGRRTLQVLGIEEFVPIVVGLDTTLRSKPDTTPFREVARALKLEPSCLVSVGDRYHVDIEPACRIGMGAILVDDVKDVYRLDRVLPLQRAKSSRSHRTCNE